MVARVAMDIYRYMSTCIRLSACSYMYTYRCQARGEKGETGGTGGGDGGGGARGEELFLHLACTRDPGLSGI